MIKQNIKIITEGVINKMIPSNKNFLKTNMLLIIYSLLVFIEIKLDSTVHTPIIY